MHDMSKFLPSEFIPYARYFYGEYPDCNSGIITTYPHLTKQGVEADFDKAWLLHIHRNPHHWQYWLLQEDDGDLKALPMANNYMIEMVCDWRGAGMAITGKDDLVSWYAENRHRMIISEATRITVDRLVAQLNNSTKHWPEAKICQQ